jgi:hypothetical protein
VVEGENKLGSFCTSCGTKIEPTAAFCTNCGAKREIAIQPAAVVAAPSVEAPIQVAISSNAADLPAATSPIVVSNVVPISPPPELHSVISFSQKPKGSGSKTIILIAALIVFLAAAVGGWKYWQKSTRVEIEVSSDSPSLPSGGTTHVEAEVPNPLGVNVQWSVREGSSGGSITGAGALAEQGTIKFVAAYTAPATPGTYHIVATLSDNSESTGEAVIVVTSGSAQ